MEGGGGGPAGTVIVTFSRLPMKAKDRSSSVFFFLFFLFFFLFSFSLLFATGRHRSIIPCRDRCLFKAVGVAVPLSPFSSHDQTVGSASLYLYTVDVLYIYTRRVQELRESRGGGPGLSVLTSLLVSVDVKLY